LKTVLLINRLQADGPPKFAVTGGAHRQAHLASRENLL